MSKSAKFVSSSSPFINSKTGDVAKTSEGMCSKQGDGVVFIYVKK